MLFLRPIPFNSFSGLHSVRNVLDSRNARNSSAEFVILALEHSMFVCVSVRLFVETDIVVFLVKTIRAERSPFIAELMASWHSRNHSIYKA